MISSLLLGNMLLCNDITQYYILIVHHYLVILGGLCGVWEVVLR